MMTQTIELIYDRGCPNVAVARRQLIRALSRVGKFVEWQEWCRDDPRAPAYVTRYGSPTILVDGRDVDPATDTVDSCRLYSDSGGSVSSAPSMHKIIGGLEQTKRSGFDWRAGRAWIPAVGIAFLPKVVCPACWPAYAAAVGVLGLSFMTQVQYLLPLTVLALFFLLMLLGWQARSHQGYGPLLLALFAGAGLLAGKFYYDSTSMTYASGSLLLIACLWHNWPLPKAINTDCPHCMDNNHGMKEES